MTGDEENASDVDKSSARYNTAVTRQIQQNIKLPACDPHMSTCPHVPYSKFVRVLPACPCFCRFCTVWPFPNPLLSWESVFARKGLCLLR